MVKSSKKIDDLVSIKESDWDNEQKEAEEENFFIKQIAISVDNVVVLTESNRMFLFLTNSRLWWEIPGVNKETIVTVKEDASKK